MSTPRVFIIVVLSAICGMVAVALLNEVSEVTPSAPLPTSANAIPRLQYQLPGASITSTVAVILTPTPDVIPTATPAAQSTSPPRVVDVDAALAKMRQDVDIISGVTTYSANDTLNSLSAYDESLFFLYVRKSAEDLALFIQINYVGDNWLFVQDFSVRAGEDVFNNQPPVQPSRKVLSGGTVKEWVNIPAESAELNIVRAILDSDYAIVRLNGQYYYHDIFMGAKQKQAIRDVLDAYQALGGQSVPSRDMWPAQPVDLLRSQIAGKWKNLSGGQMWEFTPDGKVQIVDPNDDYNSSGTYNFPEDGGIEYKFSDLDMTITRYVEIHGELMFFLDEWSNSFFQYQRLNK